MELTPFVDQLHSSLMIAAHAGGDDARALAERLVAPLDSATRLLLLEALAAAAAEITQEIAPGSVELRLLGRDPSFVVTLPPSEDMRGERGESPALEQPATVVDATEIEEGGTSRVTLRLPDALKSRIDEAANQEGLSVNTWLVRAAASALDDNTGDRRGRGRNRGGGNRYTGWVR